METARFHLRQYYAWLENYSPGEGGITQSLAICIIVISTKSIVLRCLKAKKISENRIMWI